MSAVEIIRDAAERLERLAVTLEYSPVTAPLWWITEINEVAGELRRVCGGQPVPAAIRERK